MAERDRYIPGVPCWVDTSQPDPDAAVDFYSGLFKWQFENVMPSGSGGKYFIARLDGREVAAVGGLPESPPRPATWDTYVWVESADETAAKVRAAGGRVVTEPFDVMDAGRTAVCTDPEGAAFCIWQANAHRGARAVNEPGSLNFNGLNTRDAEGAKSFYGSVFGWGTLTLPGGFEMWTCPATATISSSTTPASASAWRSSAARRGSRTSWRASTPSRPTGPRFRRTGA